MIKGNAVRVYLVLSGATALFNALMFTLQQVYYVQTVGMNALQLVLVGTVMELATFVFEVPTGVVADTVSRRLSVIVGMFITGAGFLIQGLVPHYGAILLGSVIWGIGFTFISGARQAWIAGEVSEAELRGVLLRAGQVREVAVFVGIFLATSLGMIVLALPIIVGSTLTILLGLWLLWVMPEHGFQPAPRTERTTWHALRTTFGEGVRVVRSSPILLTLTAVTAFTGAASEGFDRLGDAHLLNTVHLPRLGNLEPVVWFGIIQAGAQLLSIATIQVSRRRLERISAAAVPRVLLIANTLTVAALAVFALAGNLGLAIGAIWSMVIIGAVSGPLYEAWLAGNISPTVRATVFSMVSQANSMGQFVGGPVIGTVGTTYGLRAALLLAAIFKFPAAVLYALLLRRGHKAVAGGDPRTRPAE
jgi:DHA3 family tetracycline resistance protein-like MFS transporter